ASPLTVLPSSHSSPASTTSFPQLSNRHDVEQPSPPTRLPSSQSSPGSRTSSPHRWQSGSSTSTNVSPSSSTPLSHTSLARKLASFKKLHESRPGSAESATGA